MVTSETIETVILSALHSLNNELPDDAKIQVNGQTALFGVDAMIDSLSLVSLIVDIESALNSDHGLEISLTDDRAMTRSVSPYTDVAALKSYIVELASERQ
jgi:hypothetical protein